MILAFQISLAFFIATPLVMAGVFFIGLVIGGQLNRGIYRLAWRPRNISPWTAPHSAVPPRSWQDCVPIVGWIALRRESEVHGNGFWVRPLLIELLFASGMVVLFHWEMSGEIVPGAEKPPAAHLLAGFLSHAILLSLLLVATFIDIDEKTIPDAITVPGALVGLGIAFVLPNSLLPVGAESHLLLTEPSEWPSPSWLDGRHGLLLGIACYVGWCFALLPKTWWTRSGWRKAVRYFAASLFRHRTGKLIALMALAGSCVVAMFWSFGGPRWQAHLTALVGMAFGGGLVWTVRVVAGNVLGKEAMGFGDVTLMAMIGAYVGWQSALIIFFLAPIAGVVIAVVQWFVTRQPDIAYGPFLSVATLGLIVGWAPIWIRWGAVFWLGWLIPILLAFSLVAMALMLGAWRLLVGRWSN